jgi:hypothetical protein
MGRIPQVNSQTITVAGHGKFDFPREMTPDQIRDVLRKKFPSDKEIVFAPPFDPSQPYEVVSTPSPTPESEKPRQLSDEEILLNAAKAHKRPLTANDIVTVYHPAVDFYYQPDWVDEWKWYPAFWPAKSLLLTPFIAQTVFLSILVAVLANWQRRKRTRT